MSQPTYTFNAQVRNDMGKGASRRLRREGKVPAVLYGAGKDAVALTLEHDKINNAADHEGFYSHILTLTVDGKKIEAIVKDMQRHPFKPKIIHLDFQRVDAKQELNTSVPLHFLNEEDAQKAGGVVVHHLNEVEIAVLPKNLPEFIEVDVAGLGVGDNIHLSDLKLPEGVSLVELTKGEDHDQVVVTVSAKKTEAEDGEAAAEEADKE
ncbi:50S ribosomal protein L25/general stress protein Ctc [Aliidiomarina maris]|uniref:Large ribosomal subunit protein bL25 n=1 Tax=Aliidiomarina maris TaxID=531312 RepID=A0A327WX62_9GAMM|nr:50S ribosomal protein L25/general stress protein Ctc [Aliidiomarina maris]MBA3989128.1 50S ribosomal protein L25 [Idiomarina sp.]MCL5050061.1 50S ribosomal protein L25/general stress protein Ctc [Bacillota bacterium]RAJ96804.1 LSU ribosomal protein L25P [Aliidiomarina maris]RUO24250.1 50S ribosomal protein L25 [Aliidiomarina maris]